MLVPQRLVPLVVGESKHDERRAEHAAGALRQQPDATTTVTEALNRQTARDKAAAERPPRKTPAGNAAIGSATPSS